MMHSCVHMCVDNDAWMCILVLECHDMSVSAFTLNVCMPESLQLTPISTARG